MKRFFVLLLLIQFALNSHGQTIYGLSVKNIDGGNITLASYEGKKILFIVAPVSSFDSAKLQEIKSFQDRYGDTVKLVGILSIEDGYSPRNKTAIKDLYQSYGIDMVLTTGMQTRTFIGSSLTLMKWLTDKNENGKFTVDVKGIGQKFLVNASGGLCNVIPVNISLSTPLMQRILTNCSTN